MKLLVCSSEYPPIISSGIGNVVHYLVNELEENGIECTICSPTGPDIQLGRADYIQKYGILGLLHFWNKVRTYSYISDFDAIWLHNPFFLKRVFFNKLIATFHSTYLGFLRRKASPRIYYFVASLIEAYCLNRIQRNADIVGVSQEVCNELRDILNNDKTHCINNGVDIRCFKPVSSKKLFRKKYGLIEDGLIILSVGRIAEVKQPFKLIELQSKLEDKFINNVDDFMLVVAGDGPLLSKSKAFVQGKKLKKVKFLGKVNHKEISSLYACADYYIMTSKYEGQPLTLLEAMSSGLPCIVPNIPSLRFIKNAGAGITVNFDDLDAACNKICDYMESNEGYNGIKAREYAEQNFDWSFIAKKYSDIILLKS